MNEINDSRLFFQWIFNSDFNGCLQQDNPIVNSKQLLNK